MFVISFYTLLSACVHVGTLTCDFCLDRIFPRAPFFTPVELPPEGDGLRKILCFRVCLPPPVFSPTRSPFEHAAQKERVFCFPGRRPLLQTGEGGAEGGAAAERVRRVPAGAAADEDDQLCKSAGFIKSGAVAPSPLTHTTQLLTSLIPSSCRAPRVLLTTLPVTVTHC